MQNLLKYWMAFVQWGSSRGFPVFFLRDPRTKEPSVSLTMMVTTFLFCLLGLVNTASHSKLLGDLDETSAFNLFMATAALYFGRNLTGSNGSKLDANTTITDTTTSTTTNTSTNKDNQ